MGVVDSRSGSTARAGRRNVTVQLDAAVIRQAKVLAAERSVSLSRLLAQEIERGVGEAAAYEAARREAQAILEEGVHLGGRPLPTREALHVRGGAAGD